MDNISVEQRSWVMSRIRGKDTRPEMKLRRHLHALGFRYSLHAGGLPGKPDLCLRKWRTLIFVHGCFWHRHEGCKLAGMPKSNVEFWKEKFRRTLERDKVNLHKLRALGWRVIIVWECELDERLASLPEEIKSGAQV
ncbi:MAG: DNA mismatch endonuclease Vsr [Lentisphaeria bacterium]|nr:DNA mismatch endonuclease Vsr [Lentisphaeria bacterium]MDY0175381.1 DNA mismatch endonuclease Vsr [Lentisphaeria bacterium]